MHRWRDVQKTEKAILKRRCLHLVSLGVCPYTPITLLMPFHLYSCNYFRTRGKKLSPIDAALTVHFIAFFAFIGFTPRFGL